MDIRTDRVITILTPNTMIARVYSYYVIHLIARKPKKRKTTASNFTETSLTCSRNVTL